MTGEYGWHWVGEKLRDDTSIPPDGEWLEVSGPIVICERGLHFSSCPFDALQFAPGNTLCRVEVEDVVERQSDKAVCRRRRIIARRDMEADLWAFARQCALDVAHLWGAPDVVMEYLRKGDESLRTAARAAARAAAGNAEGGAARAAARAAAGNAARAAARTAARAAAGDAARAAARAAAWVAAGDAAWVAARAAAGDAAWAAQRTRFAAIVNSRFSEFP